MRVLVVEDEPKMGRLLKRGLGEEGHPADVVPTGEEALRRASTGRYDAIVLDLALPGLEGFATCRELRSRGVWTPVLLLSAHDVVADRIAGLDIGADDCLVKPVLVRGAAGAPARARPPCAGRVAHGAAGRQSASRLDGHIVPHGPLPARRRGDLIAAVEARDLRGRGARFPTARKLRALRTRRGWS